MRRCQKIMIRLRRLWSSARSGLWASWSGGGRSRCFQEETEATGQTLRLLLFQSHNQNRRRRHDDRSGYAKADVHRVARPVPGAKHLRGHSSSRRRNTTQTWFFSWSTGRGMDGSGADSTHSRMGLRAMRMPFSGSASGICVWRAPARNAEKNLGKDNPRDGAALAVYNATFYPPAA